MTKNHYYELIEEISCNYCEREYIKFDGKAIEAVSKKTVLCCKECKNTLYIDLIRVPVSKKYYTKIQKEQYRRVFLFNYQLSLKTEKDIVVIEDILYTLYINIKHQ